VTPLDESACEALVALARAHALAAIRGEAPPAPAPGALPPLLREPGAAFVTLHVAGALRGCIGRIEAGGAALAEVVAQMAEAAATSDRRFAPILPSETSSLEVEVSVLGPLIPVSHPGEILVGRDGLVIESGTHRGLLLPQVAVEQGWDRETFLAQACRKAQLPPDAWRRGADVFRFEAHVCGGHRAGAS
jgi:AmmeMemoRadiSam system protein A